ncbi:MAG: hypothetical protein AB1416_06915 [Actinomycetota bacterium]
MPGVRRVIRACLLAVAALALTAPLAAASPRDVVADYWADGQIDPSVYSTADLKGALREPTVASGGGVYDAFADIIHAELTARLVGGRDGDRPAAPPSAPVTKGPGATGGGTVTAGQNEIPGPLPGPVPTPPAAAADDDLPLAFLILSGAAGVLVLSGGAVAAIRRLRR